MQTWRRDLFSYLGATWRYRWQGLAAAWVVCVVGWVAIAVTPSTYESAAEVYIDTHTLLNPLLKGLAVTPDPNQEIAVVMQTLLSDPTLQRVVRATNPSAQSMSSSQIQDAIASLRNHISLKNLRTKDLYSISYTDNDPAYAQSVAQTLVSVLIDSSLGSQRRDADKVGTFIENQIATYEQKLEAADKRRADFKTAHLEFFARTSDGEKVGGAGDVVAAQAAVAGAQSTLNEAIGRRDSLHEQLQKTPQTLSVNSPLPATMDRTGTAISRRAQLAAATAKLNTLRTQYTEQYPDVVAQRRLVERLKSEKPDDTAGTEGISNPGYVMMMSKLADMESEVAADHSRLEEANRRLEDAKKVAAKAITVQREYENLDRDYQVLHKNFEELVSRRESAKITQAAGDQQSSVVFRVISPPVKPDRPVAPNRLLLNAVALLAAIGAGCGLAFGLGQFSGTFMDMGQLKEAFELPILGAVTMVRTGADISNTLRSNTLFATGLGLLFVVSAIVLYRFNVPLASGKGPVL